MMGETQNPFEMRINKTGAGGPWKFTPILEKLCEIYYQMPEVIGPLNEKFDLVLAISLVFQERGYLWIHTQNGCSVYSLPSPMGPFPSSYSANGNPVPPSIIPHHTPRFRAVHEF